jgi:hypothetical protein
MKRDLAGTTVVKYTEVGTNNFQNFSESMGEGRKVYKVLVGKTEGKRPL